MVHAKLLHFAIEVGSLHSHSFGGQGHIFIARFDLLIDVPDLKIIGGLS